MMNGLNLLFSYHLVGTNQGLRTIKDLSESETQKELHPQQVCVWAVNIFKE